MKEKVRGEQELRYYWRTKVWESDRDCLLAIIIVLEDERASEYVLLSINQTERFHSLTSQFWHKRCHRWVRKRQKVSERDRESALPVGQIKHLFPLHNRQYSLFLSLAYQFIYLVSPSPQRSQKRVKVMKLIACLQSLTLIALNLNSANLLTVGKRERKPEKRTTKHSKQMKVDKQYLSLFRADNTEQINKQKGRRKKKRREPRRLNKRSCENWVYDR